MNRILTTVAEGDKVQMIPVDGVEDKHTVTVGPYHTSEPGDSGHWFCVTHDEHFQNQLQKDLHINTGNHQLAWICDEHGIEQPQRQAVRS